MPDSDASHIARLEERVEGLREDHFELMADLRSVFQRLQALEGVATSFANAQKSAREKEDKQYRRLTHAIAFLAVVVAVAAIIVPLIVTHQIGG